MSYPTLLSTDGKYWKTSHSFIVIQPHTWKWNKLCTWTKFSWVIFWHFMLTSYAFINTHTSDIAHWKSTDILQECVTFIFRAEKSAKQETNMKLLACRPWIWSEYVPLKHWSTFNIIHSVISQVT
jgi:hypothetical protein